LKRFTETTKWSDPWFRKLSPAQKVFWHFICDNCDNSGVWKVDMELASFQCGTQFDEKELIGAFKDRIRDIGKGRWWVEKFVPFQYGELSESSKPHQKVISLLASHKLPARGYPEGIDTLNEEEKEKDKEKKKGESEGKRPRPQDETEVIAFCLSKSIPEVDAKYFWEKWRGNGFKNNNAPMRDWQGVILSWKHAGHLPSQKNGTHQRSNAASGRNIGTANEGRSNQYAGVGKTQ